jgi:hypothetical protein
MQIAISDLLRTNSQDTSISPRLPRVARSLWPATPWRRDEKVWIKRFGPD